MGWVIVVVHDGPMRLQVFTADDGKAFPTQEAAERAASVWQRQGVSYSIYTVQTERV
jgi:hypothetical protein